MAITLIENFRAIFYAPFYAALALRAYEHEGLDVTVRMASEAAGKAQFLVPAEGDVSWGGPLRLMLTLEKNPAGRAVAFCEVVRRDPFFLVGREPNPAFRLEHLSGRRVATVSEVPTPWICLQHDLRLAGIDIASLRRVPHGSMTGNAAALRAGRADVIQVFQPYAAELQGDGSGHVWYAAAGRGLTSYTTLNTTRAYLDAHPEVALGLCRGMQTAQKWIADHEAPELAALIAPWFPGLSRRVLASSLEAYKSLGIWNTSPVMEPAGLEWLRDAALASGLLRTRFDYHDCVEMRFAREVAGV